MTDPDSLLIILLVLLFVLDILTSATRSAFLNSNLARLLGSRDEWGLKVNRTQALLMTLPRLQASLGFTRTVTRFLIAGIALLIFLPLENNQYLAVYSFLILIIFSSVVFLSQLLVEWYVAREPEIWAMRLTPFAKFMITILTPILALPLMLYGKANGDRENLVTVTEDELLTLVETGQQEGILEQDEQQMIFSIFRLGDTLTREIMVPRIDVLALEINTTLQEAVDTLLKSGYSRLPVYHERIDNIRGLLYAKDLLRMWHETSQLVSLEELLRPAYFVPETKKVDELLAEMQSQRIHMGIVVDEYGGVAGLVTLEDIVEEIVGEIQDEFDDGEELPFAVISDSEYVFQGQIDLDDFNDTLRSDLPKDDADTLGGFILSRIGRVPIGGEVIEFNNLQLTVEQVTGRRIRKVRVKLIPPSTQKIGETDHVE